MFRRKWKMKTLGVAVWLLIVMSTTSVVAQSDAQKSFDQLKSLAGFWEGEEVAGGAGESLLPHDGRRVRADERNRWPPRRGDDLNDPLRRRESPAVDALLRRRKPAAHAGDRLA